MSTHIRRRRPTRWTGEFMLSRQSKVDRRHRLCVYTNVENSYFYIFYLNLRIAQLDVTSKMMVCMKTKTSRSSHVQRTFRLHKRISSWTILSGEHQVKSKGVHKGGPSSPISPGLLKEKPAAVHRVVRPVLFVPVSSRWAVTSSYLKRVMKELGTQYFSLI